MKNLRILSKSLFCLSLIVILISCSEDEEDSRNNRRLVTEQDASEIINTALQRQKGGFPKITANLLEVINSQIIAERPANSSMAAQQALECNSSLVDDTYAYNYDGQFLDANYTGIATYTLNCNNFGIPSIVSYNGTTDGGFETPRIRVSGQTDTSISVSGLQFLDQEFVLNGTFEREGNLDLKFRNADLTSTFTLSLSNVKVDKYTEEYEIKSGTGEITLFAVSGNDTYNFSATIVFNGGGEATLIIGTETYVLNLE